MYKCYKCDMCIKTVNVKDIEATQVVDSKLLWVQGQLRQLRPWLHETSAGEQRERP